MSKLTAAQVEYLVRFQKRLSSKTVIWDIFGQVEDRPTIEIDPPAFVMLKNKGSYTDVERDFTDIDEKIAKPGDVFKVTSGKNACIAYIDSTDTIALLSMNLDRPIVWMDTFTLKKDMIANYDGPDIETSAGRFFLNAVVLVLPFGDVFPYVNTKWSPGKIEDMVAAELRNETVTADQVIQFINLAYHVGSLTMLCVVTATAKSFVTDPAVKKRKEELLTEFAGQLHDPRVAHRIEAELEAIDREHLGDDPSTRFYDAMGSKAYSLHRKTMLITGGATEDFTSDAQEFGFVANSLADGWDTEDCALLFNNSRLGSYSRGHATQLGGTLTKYIQRVLQNIEVNAEDCKTTRGLSWDMTEANASQFIGRTVRVGSTSTVLSRDNVSSFIGKTVVMRSPLHCQTKDGMCQACCGQIYKQLDQEAIAMHAVQITSAFMLSAMKAMHGSTVQILTVNPTDYMFKLVG